MTEKVPSDKVQAVMHACEMLYMVRNLPCFSMQPKWSSTQSNGKDCCCCTGTYQNIHSPAPLVLWEHLHSCRPVRSCSITNVSAPGTLHQCCQQQLEASHAPELLRLKRQHNRSFRQRHGGFTSPNGDQRQLSCSVKLLEASDRTVLTASF
jgi:hypothetical protein